MKNSVNKKKEIITLIFFTLFIILIISGIVFYLRKSREKDISIINKSFGYTKGLVIRKMTYKGRSIDVRYIVNGKTFTESDGNDSKDNVNEGDSIIVKYSTENPELMITQFNDEF